MKVSLKIENGVIAPYSKNDLKKLQSIENAIYDVELKNSKTRTLPQNRAYHLWASQISEELNNLGLTIEDVLKKDSFRILMLWNSERVKELIFKPTIKAIFNKKSSTELNVDDFDKLIDTITEAFSYKGIEIPDFPSYED